MHFVIAHQLQAFVGAPSLQHPKLAAQQIMDRVADVGFIVHQRPPGNPDVKDTANDRFFIPLGTPEIWLRQGDGRIFSCAAADDTCVVPSA